MKIRKGFIDNKIFTTLCIDLFYQILIKKKLFNIKLTILIKINLVFSIKLDRLHQRTSPATLAIVARVTKFVVKQVVFTTNFIFGHGLFIDSKFFFAFVGSFDEWTLSQVLPVSVTGQLLTFM